LGTSRADVLVVGAGPAGIAAGIAASLKGFQVVVADLRKPPIDKACGEGLLPAAAAALCALGVRLNAGSAYALRGICFEGDGCRAVAEWLPGAAFGLRRTALHDLLVERALEVGVQFVWGVRVSGLSACGAVVNGQEFACRWVVGADGQNSAVRKWAGLGPMRRASSRLGFRRHFATAPWSDLVEVYWADECQLFVTPTADDEVCVAVLGGDSQTRVEKAIALFPEVEKRLKGARATSSELGAVTVLGRLKGNVRGNVALIGDASFTLDAISGQGVGLGLQQAIQLAEALASDDLAEYEAAHRRITRMPWRLTRLILAMARRPWLRRKALRLFAARPDLFSQVVSVHTGEKRAEKLKVREVFGLGWQVLRA
jgi:menaquinone-9 beta-reductase